MFYIFKEKKWKDMEKNIEHNIVRRKSIWLSIWHSLSAVGTVHCTYQILEERGGIFHDKSVPLEDVDGEPHINTQFGK